MTKLEAWQAWCATAGTEQLADQFTLEKSSHGKAFSFAWDAAHEGCAKLCENQPMRQDIDVRDQCAAAIRARGQA